MIQSVSARNFLSWEDLSFDFETGVTAIEGLNHDDGTPEGSGKSSIPNAVCWGLYGQIPKDAKVDDVIRDGEESCEVMVTLIDGSKIVRTRKPNELYILDRSENKVKGLDAKETQSMINSLIGMGFDTFCQSVYFAQNYPDKFVSATDKKKGEILSEIQDLDQFTKAKKQVAKLITTEEAQLMSLQKDLSKEREIGVLIVQERLRYKGLLQTFEEERLDEIRSKEADLQSLKELLSEFELALPAEPLEKLELMEETHQQRIKDTENQISNIQHEVTDARRAAQQHEQVKRDLDRKTKEVQIKEKELDELEAKLVALPAADEDKAAEITTDIRTLSDAASDLRSKLKQLKEKATQKSLLVKQVAAKKAEEDRIKKKLEALVSSGTSTCPTCGGPMNEAHFLAHKEEQEQLLENVWGELSTLNEQLDAIGNLEEGTLRQELLDTEEALKQATAIQDQYRTEQTSRLVMAEKRETYLRIVNVLKKEVSALEERLASIEVKDVSPLEVEIKDFQEKLAKFQIGLVNIKDKIKLATGIKASIEQKKLKIDETEKAVAQLTIKKPGKDLVQALASTDRKLSENEAQIASLESLHQDKVSRMGRLQTLKDGFGEVKSFVFRSLLRELSKKTNRYLADLFEVPVSIKFSNEGEEGEVSKISVAVTLDGRERALGLYSGGQARRIQLAVDLALSEIIAARSSKAMNLRIFDEPFKDLSEVSMEKAVKLFETLKGSTVLIEHNSIVKSIVNNYFRVELRNGVSRKVAV